MGSKGLKFLVADNTHMFLWTLDYLDYPLEKSNEFQTSVYLKMEKKRMKNEADIEVTT